MGAGNPYYGGITYVLNPRAMKGRLFYLPWDSGLIIDWIKDYNATWPNDLGTAQHWHHLMQPHEYFLNQPFPKNWNVPRDRCCNYSIADLLNYW